LVTGRKLEEAAKGETMTLVCPVCGAEFVARGDVPLEFIVHQWAAEAGEKGHHETPEGVPGSSPTSTNRAPSWRRAAACRS
jgi:hypothetical protein